MTALCYVRRSLACKKRVDALKCSTVHALKRYKVKKDKKYIQDYRKVWYIIDNERINRLHNFRLDIRDIWNENRTYYFLLRFT